MPTNNKLIAKNSVALYVRMLLSMIMSLYTARVVLQVLGVSDYGLYNVIGGIITFFTMLKGVISSGSQRFMNYELGKNNFERLRLVFSTSLTIYIIIGAIVFVLGETVGLWFVNAKLVIPEGRLLAANVVYQVSILSALISIIQLPYTSSIIAHERMEIYGYIGLGEPLLRLLLVLLLPLFPYDKLIVYSLLILFLSTTVSVVYVIVCRKLFAECKFKLSRDRALTKEILSFTSWNLIETVTNELNDQGQNVLLNLFFGPAINAARAVAMQVNGAVRSFAINFMIAVNPQITKNYAVEDYSSFHTLIIRGAKFSIILLSVLIIPIMLNTEYILTLWLKTPPDHSVVFCQLILVALLIRIAAEPLFTGIQSTGNIKKYQIVTNAIIVFNIPLCYVLLKCGVNVIAVFIVNIAVSVVLLICRTYFLHKLTDFPVRAYLLMLMRCAFVFMLVYVPFFIINRMMNEGIVSFLILTISSLLCASLLFCFVAMTKAERQFIQKMLVSVIGLKKNDVK